MKKLMAILLATFSIAATAKETLPWPIVGLADNAANFYRALDRRSQQTTNTIHFLFDTKPGAGGTVAANFTNNNFANTLWINSSADLFDPIYFLLKVTAWQIFAVSCPCV
jgi:hypothetical protein